MVFVILGINARIKDGNDINNNECSYLSIAEWPELRRLWLSKHSINKIEIIFRPKAVNI